MRVACPCHPALSALEGDSPGDARLTDRGRLAVLLQGVALLGHLGRAGWALIEGWKGIRVAPGGRLGGARAGSGADAELPQRRAEQLLQLLFRADESIAGRGSARRASRVLLRRWRQDLAPVNPDVLVGQILEAAPFLWEARYGEARAALACEIEGELWVAGPCRFRRRLTHRCAALPALRSLLASGDAERLWGARRVSASDPLALARAGLWRRAAAAWAAAPPADATGRYEMGRVLFALGRFAAAARSLGGLRRAHARALRLECRLRLGELEAVKRTLAAWDSRPGGADPVVDLAAIAARLFSSLGDPRSARPWIDRALASSSRRNRLEAAIVAGEAAWDRGDLEELDRRLSASKAARDSGRLGWRWHHLRALAAIKRGDGESVISSMRRALSSRRRLRPIEAVSLWNDLAVGRSLVGDLAGAERALRHVVRLTEEGEGDRRLTLALCNLAEVRLRRGGCRASAMSSARGAVQRAGRQLARVGPGSRAGGALRTGSRPPGCGDRLRRGDARDVGGAGPRLAARPALVMAARAHGWLGEGSSAREALASTTAADRGELELEERAPLLALAGDLEAALLESPSGPCRDLWQQLLTGAGDDRLGAALRARALSRRADGLRCRTGRAGSRAEGLAASGRSDVAGRRSRHPGRASGGRRRRALAGGRTVSPPAVVRPPSGWVSSWRRSARKHGWSGATTTPRSSWWPAWAAVRFSNGPCMAVRCASARRRSASMSGWRSLSPAAMCLR